MTLAMVSVFTYGCAAEDLDTATRPGLTTPGTGSPTAPTSDPATATSTPTTVVPASVPSSSSAPPTTTEPEGFATTDLIGVYYYPWHGPYFHGGRYLREHLVPPQTPELGEYDDRHPETIAQHIAWSEHAGIDVWVTSWWGQGSAEDDTTRGVILPHSDLGSLRIAVHYESLGITNGYTNLDVIGSDFRYLARHYFSHPGYFTIDGRPVVVVYLTRLMASENVLPGAVEDMRTAAAAAGYDVFIIGDHAFGAPQPGAGLQLLDAITNYDVYGAIGVSGEASVDDVERYLEDQEGWKRLAESSGAAFVPSVTPGFNDTAVRAGHAPLSRVLGDGGEPGSLFRALLVGSEPLRSDSVGRLLMITSWNEWHEDTQIEPVAEAGPTTVDDSASGTAFAAGLPYEGYGTRYLDILSELSGDG
ncbi:MAG: glycoside hydrolase family 99-like domain-containing protein [Acidimicrobiia bacterium]